MSVRSPLGSVLLAGFVALAAAHPASAQGRATMADLSGVVLDQSRAVLPGATVTARDTATGIEQVAVTGPDGRYTLLALLPGVYSVTARLAGFTPGQAEHVTLALGQTANLDFTLPIARTFDQVTVVAEPPLAAIGQTAVATVISERQIDMLPTNGRNFLSFSGITAAVTTDRTPQQGAASTSGLTFAGQRARSNNITVDGLDNNDVFMGAVRATFSQEAIQEFQVIANSFPAEFGKASGGIVNVVTRHGGNTVAGNLFTYFRDAALNAREHFEKFDPAGEPLDRAKAPYRQFQFGGTLGGPIRRNRSFFFLSAERLRVRANNFVNIDDTNPVMVGDQNKGSLVDILQGFGFPIELGQVPYRVESDQVLASAYAVLNQVHRLSVRFNWAGALDENAEPWGGQVARSRGAYMESRDLMGAASLTSLFSSRTVNELRFQLARRFQTVISLDQIRCSGVCDGYNEGGPSLDIGDVKVGRQFMTPQPRTSRRYQVVDTLTHPVGHQTLRTGFDFSYIDIPSSALPRLFGGHYVFRPGMGLDERQLLALGKPMAYLQGYGNPSLAGWGSDLSLFFEDEWRVREHLTLKLGARYQKQFWPSKTAKVGDLSYAWPADNNNLAPRLAVSWSPFGSEKTSIHGAYGVFYDNHFYAIRGVPSIVDGTAEHVRMYTVPYPRAAEAWNNVPDRRLPEPANAPIDLIAFDPRLRTPYAHHVSAGVEREFGGALTLSAHGVFVRGLDQVGAIEYNPRINGGSRPVPTLGSVWQFTSWAGSWYRGLTVSLGRRYSRGFGFLASYTLSRAEDMATDYAFTQPQDCGLGRDPADPLGLPLAFNPDLERARSLQDQRHRLVLSGEYALPAAVTVSGIVTVGSGRPFNIVAGADLNKDGDTVQSDRPRTNPADGATSIARNAGLLPGTSTVDVRVAKRLALGGRVKLDLMVEMFNLFNHTNYTQVNAVFGPGAYPNERSDTFGRFTKAAPPFQAQLVAKVSF